MDGPFKVFILNPPNIRVYFKSVPVTDLSH